jgi:glutaconate CoA-transferase subunit B
VSGPAELAKASPGGPQPASTGFTAEEMMTVAAARELRDGQTCLVGIGLPGAAANLARLTHAPGVVLIYESGPIGAKPRRLPLSIGDGELAETAGTVVGLAEIFNYWIQAGRIDLGMVGTAQIDRYANLNTTVIGGYEAPSVRLPGAGGAPEIVGSCREVIVVVRHQRRSFVPEVDFVTSVGFGRGPGDRERLGLKGEGPKAVVTDLGVLRPDPQTCELTLTELHPGASVEQVQGATGWPLAVSARLRRSAPPTLAELQVLRDLQAGKGAGS